MSQVYEHFCLQLYTLFILLLPLHIICFLHLPSTNHKYSSLLFAPAVQNRYSKGEAGLEFFDNEF
jgi:hypothetical protein